MTKKERLKKMIEANKVKIAELRDRVKEDEEELERLEAFELKYVANEIDAKGLDTIEILKAIQNFDYETVKRLMHPTNDEQQERSEEKYLA